MKNLLFLFIVIYCCSCEGVNQDNSNIEFHNTHKLVKSENVRFMARDITPASLINMTFCHSGDHTYLALPDYFDQSISFYQLGDEDKIKKVYLEREGPNGVGNMDVVNFSLLFEAPDSIFFSHFGDKTIYLIDTTGLVHNKYYTDLDPNPLDIAAYSNPIFPAIKKDNKLIYPAVFEIKDIRNFDFTKLFSIMNLDMKEEEFYYELPLPSLFNDNYYSLHNDFYISNIADFEERECILLAYPSLPYVYKYNVSSHSVIKKHPIVSQSLKRIEIFSEDRGYQMDNFPVHNEYWRYTDRFGKLINLKNGYYLREVIDRPSKIEYDNGKKDYALRYIIFNEDFKILGETQFARGQYDISAWFTDGKGGFYLLNKKELAEDENFYVFDRYEIADMPSE